ncbi:MSHA biogenesis protein MshK [Oceanisphaera sp. IT1-181]|uniref:MSHA biogenesis protein MshK n=1 Tax=Oceanisphaera sp. IT1-181 TaxID=3081199 RepID=UPI0029CA1863|nr:MSHA biogenesis protein MshK [Oceanisphaera sp. IT1-181]
MVNPLLLLLLSTTAGIQDPTQPLTQATVVKTEPSVINTAPASQLHLQAIFSGGKNSAIIDGQSYRVGDTVQDYRLVRIQPSQVVLNGPGAPLTLTLFPSLSTLSN